jgi:hypothetical protein
VIHEYSTYKDDSFDHEAYRLAYEASYNDDDQPALTEFQKGRLERIAQKKGVSVDDLRKSAFLMALVRHDWQKVG